MEQVIVEHLTKSFQTLNLLFDVDLPFVKIGDRVKIFNHVVFGETDTGILIEEGIIQKNKKEGWWIYWWRNGQKYSEGEFRKGKMNGLWSQWYDNGQKWKEGIYLNGKKEGLWASWSYNGQKEYEGNY